MVPTFFGITLITFLMIQLAPGSPVAVRLAGAEGGMATDAATAEIIEQTRALYGLDDPLPIQYLNWLGRLFTLDFGNSFVDQRAVIDKIADALPITLMFSGLSIVLTYLIAIPLGVYSATNQRTIGDYVTTLILFILYSLPNFWVAMLLIMFLGGGSYFDVFPVSGLSSIDASSYSTLGWLGDRLWHMVLPLFCMTYVSLAGLSRYMRSGMLETIRQDYIRTARAYGFRERTVVYVFAMRNSIITIITLLGGLLPALISGSVIIESVFSIPGMGGLAFGAVLARDYPTIMAVFTVSALLTLVGLLVSDLLYALVDPRIQLK